MSTVPSNLIPSRISQLPADPAPSSQGWLMYIRDGVTYKVQAADLLSVTGVPPTRQVLAGTSLIGGGQLSSDVTLSVPNGGIGTAQLASTGVAPGSYGDATHIPVVTVDTTGRVSSVTTVLASAASSVPTSRQVLAGSGLTGGGPLTGDVTLSASLSDLTPQTLENTGASGVSATISRADHRHPAVDLASDAQVDGLVGLDHGGTARSLVANAGGMVWSGADGLYIGPPGVLGQIPVSGGAGAPSWGSALLVSNQPANYLYGGPASGPDAATTFRAMVNADLPASGVIAATYGSATQGSQVIINAKGVVTSASSITVTPAFSSVSGKPTTLSGYGITDGQPLDADLSAIGALVGTTGLLRKTAADTWALDTAAYGTGSVTSVDMSVPTGLSLLGNPITTNGTLAISLQTGYSIPATASQSNWDTAYTDRNKWDGGSTGLTAATGRTSLGATTVGSNLFTLTNPTAITFPRFNADNTVSALIAADFRTAIGAGTSSEVGTVTSVAALTLGTTGTDLSSTVATGTTTPVITLNVPTASATNRGALSAADWSTFNAKLASAVTTISFGTTGLTPATGTAGAVTVAGTLAIANGGTNSTATATAGGAGYGTGTAHAYTAAGTAGQILTSAGAAAPVWGGISGGTF